MYMHMYVRKVEVSGVSACWIKSLTYLLTLPQLAELHLAYNESPDLDPNPRPLQNRALFRARFQAPFSLGVLVRIPFCRQPFEL